MPEAKERTYVCSFGPVQKLFEAAQAVVEAADYHAGNMAVLKEAVRLVEQCGKDSEALDPIREIARDQYIDSSCDIDIDNGNFTHHNGEPSDAGGGYWVGAWLWVGEELDGVEPPELLLAADRKFAK